MEYQNSDVELIKGSAYVRRVMKLSKLAVGFNGQPSSISALRSDGQLASGAAFHESCSVRIVSNLYSRGINYRQKVGDLLSDHRLRTSGNSVIQ
jgi:hypothetical protein